MGSLELHKCSRVHIWVSKEPFQWFGNHSNSPIPTILSVWFPNSDVRQLGLSFSSILWYDVSFYPLVAVSNIVGSRVAENGEAVVVWPCPFCTITVCWEDGGVIVWLEKHLSNTSSIQAGTWQFVPEVWWPFRTMFRWIKLRGPVPSLSLCCWCSEGLSSLMSCPWCWRSRWTNQK